MRKFLSLLMAVVFGVSTVFATTVYCKMEHSWWTQDGAAVAVHHWGGSSAGTTWPGVRMAPVAGEEGLWSYDVPADVTGLMFVRVNGSGDIADWGAKTANLTLPTDGKNLFTITNESATWGDPGCTGEWSTYTPATTGGEEEDTYAYVKVTSAPTSWDGEYLIVYEGDSVAFNSSLANNTNDYVGIGGKYCRFSVKIHNDTIDYHDTIAAKHFTIAAIEGKTTYSIKSASKLYLGRTGTSNGLDKSSTTVYENSISYNEGNFVDIVSSAGLYMRYNKNSNEQRFRFFKADTYTAQQAIQLYKKVKIEATSGEQPEQPETPAAKDSIYFVNVAGWETPVVHLWGGTAAGTSWPGVAMIKLADQINNYDVYKYVADAGAYAHCIFSNNGANQTVDLDWTSGKYFYNGAWYELDSIPAPAAPVKFRVVGDGEQFGNWSVENGMASYSDTLVMHLEAGNYKFKVVAGENWYGFTALTDTAAGLKELDKDKNIGFELKEASDVTVIFNASVFKLVGNFYVAPAADPTVAVIGSMTEWQQAIPFVLAEDKQSATFADTIPAGEYEFKMIINGEWRSNGWWFNRNVLGAANITGNDDANMVLQADVTGFYTFTWYFANDSLAMEFPAAPVVIPAKFYVTGDSALVVDAGLTADKAWASNAIKSEADTLVLNLKAEQAYKLKVTVDGTWDSVKSFENLTDTAAGLTADNDGNICFTLAEAGEVQVIYTAELFKLVGNFYVAPAADPTVAVIGSMTEWQQAIPFVLAEDKLSATFSDTIPAGEYEFKMLINGEYRSNGWWFNRNVLGAANITGNDDANMLLQADVTGFYTFTWYFANDSLAMEFPAAPVVVPAKFYVTGDSALVVDAGLTADKAWASNAIKSEADTLVLNLKAEQAYKLKVTVDGTWDSVKSFENLTDTAAGLTADNDGNICFTLAEAGEVQVIYTAELFKLVGNFYVAPAADPTVAVIGSMTEWQQAIPFVLAEDKQSASFSDTIPAGEYEFKMLINGEYRSNGWWFNRNVLGAANITGNDDANMLLQADVTGFYTFTWYFANDSLAMEFPAAPVVVPAKFYVTGDSALVVDAGLTADKAWASNAIKSEADTLVLNLKAEQAYKLKVTVDGTWDSVKSFENLTDTAAGLTADNDGNICFTLAEAGEVQVIYTAELFKLVGSFYVAPAADPTAAVIGTMTEWQQAIPFVLAEDKLSATFSDTIPAGEYEFKMLINGEYRSNGWWFNRNVLGAANITENNDANMLLQADVTGFYTFTWYFANDSLAMEFPAAPVVVPAKFYVTGDSALVVDAGLTADKAWASNAIKSEADTLVLNLKAEQAYKLKVTVDGTWDSVKSFENLTDTAAGLTADNDGNICFTLAEAGEVQVIYTAELFKLVGNFYVAPAADPTVAVIGSMTEWQQAIPFVLAEDKLSASFSDTIPAGEYEFKMLINGEYRSNGWWFNRNVLGAANITGNDDANMVLQADVTGFYTFTWYFANDSLAMEFPEQQIVVPTLEDGYYLVGTMNDWTPAAEYKLAENTEAAGEYFLARTFVAEEAFKVVAVANDAITTWYPDNAGDYVVDGNHAGATTVYFRPDYQGGEGWHAGCIFVVPTGTVDIDNVDVNAPAVKVLRDGQIYIIKGAKMYNAQGVQVK